MEPAEGLLLGWSDEECPTAHTNMELDDAWPSFSDNDALRDIAGPVGSQDVGASCGAWLCVSCVRGLVW